MEKISLEVLSLVAGQVSLGTALNRPNQVLTAMLKLYAAADTKDLLALCLVSRTFRDVATAWLHRSIILDVEHEKPFRLLAERMSSRTACHVRECQISSLTDSAESQLKMLQSLLRRLPTLRRFK